MAARGGYNGVFQYDSDYLNHLDAYDLDPANLKLSTDLIRAFKPESGIHGVFQNSLPGRWGNRLLAYKAGFSERHYAPPHLLAALGNSGMGAILYSEEIQVHTEIKDPSIDFADLAKAMEEADSYEQDETLQMELKFLVTAGYSAGGARPKVLVKKMDSIWQNFPVVMIGPQHFWLTLKQQEWNWAKGQVLKSHILRYVRFVKNLFCWLNALM